MLTSNMKKSGCGVFSSFCDSSFGSKSLNTAYSKFKCSNLIVTTHLEERRYAN